MKYTDEFLITAFTNSELIGEGVYRRPTAVLQLHDPIDAGESNVHLFWPFEQAVKEDIEATFPGCGCTAQISIDNDGIRATYADNHRWKDVLEEGQDFVKTISVTFKDGIPMYVKAANGANQWNPEKRYVVLRLTGTVKGAKKS